MKRQIRFTRCPRCGSKNLQVEEPLTADDFVVSCLDCEAVLETHRRKESNSRQRQRGGHRKGAKHSDEFGYDDA